MARNFPLKELKEPNIIVMNNAAFHKKSDIKSIVEKAGHVLLPLSPYSPDSNPIEQSFAAKARARNDKGAKLSVQRRPSHVKKTYDLVSKI